MNQQPDKPRINVTLSSKADVLRYFAGNCAFVKVLVVLILTLPTIAGTAAAVLYAAHHVGMIGSKQEDALPRVHPVQAAEATTEEVANLVQLHVLEGAGAVAHKLTPAQKVHHGDQHTDPAKPFAH